MPMPRYLYPRYVVDSVVCLQKWKAPSHEIAFYRTSLRSWVYAVHSKPEEIFEMMPRSIACRSGRRDEWLQSHHGLSWTGCNNTSAGSCRQRRSKFDGYSTPCITLDGDGFQFPWIGGSGRLIPGVCDWSCAIWLVMGP